MGKSNRTEVLLWSIALPGFGQILNGKFLKGFLFIGLEFLINIQSNFNTVIKFSFHGDITEAISHTNYQWLMFYPCLYMFAVWDAYRDAGGGNSPYAVLPTVFGAYAGTIGVIFSPSFKIMGLVFGPVWLSIIGVLVGLVVGGILRIVLLKWKSS
jgi:hypothetical protein